MNPERWRQVEDLFHAALEKDPGERDDFLTSSTNNDEELRREVESLLAQQEHSILESSPLHRDVSSSDDMFREIGLGSQIGPYIIEAVLGAGGMGQVFKACDVRLQRTVAIKVLVHTAFTRSELKQRFLRESRAASALNHPNIVTLYDAGTADAIDFLAMEYVPGKSLDRLMRDKSLSTREAVDIATQIASGLAAAHAVGVVHRDIKPSNVVITPERRVKVLDFGLAKRTPASGDKPQPDLTATGMVMGTVPYMSPEQAADSEVDHRTDIFSLGVVLYEMLARRKPFDRKSSVEILHAIIHDRAPEMPQLPAALREILDKALEKNPAERYQHAGDFEIDLRRFARNIGPNATPAASTKRKIGLWIAIGSALALFAIAVSLAYLAQSRAWMNPLADANFDRITDFDGIEVDAVISPDGRSSLFLSDRAGAVDAWFMRIGGADLANLTKGAFPGLYVRGIRSVGFSHDGAQVWVRVESDPTGRTAKQGTWLIPLVGGSPRLFLDSGVEPHWSPDGSKIVYHESTAGDAIFVADQNGGDARKILQEQPGLHNHYLTWSQDSRSIYFVRGLPLERTDIWRIPAEGGDPERITHHNSHVGHPALLDARTLAYTATTEEGFGPWLYAKDLQTGITRRISVGAEQYHSLSASADGRRLVATVGNLKSELWSVPILTKIATDADTQKFPLDTGRSTGPRFGPDYVLFLSSRGGADGLWRSEKGVVTELWNATNGGLTGPAAVSPDGRAVSFSVRKGGHRILYWMSSQGTQLRRLHAGEAVEVSGTPTWSPDGKWIAVTADENNKRKVIKLSVDGGAPVTLVTGSPTNPVWSPDGTLIVYRVRQGPAYMLKAVKPDGVPAPLQSMTAGVTAADAYRFIPNTQSMVVLKGDAPVQNFWLFDLATGVRRQLTNFEAGPHIDSFDISPDGKQILFDRRRENSDVVVVERRKP